MKKVLLIIGAGIEQVPAYKLAKRMGLYVVGTDRDPKAPAFKVSDDRLIASTRDVRATLDAVLKYTKNRHIDGVMTIANDVPLTVAKVASKLKLPGISVTSARLASNKALMKRRFKKCGVPTPEFYLLEKEQDLLKNINRTGFPSIIKPSDGRGARGVLLLDKNMDLSWAWDTSHRYSESGILILEKFAKGPQLSVEGIFIKNRYVPVAFADRNYDNIDKTRPYLVENGGVIPSRFRGKVLKNIAKVISKASRSLGISWGSVKADIVITNKGPQIIELAARMSGNYLATHHIPMAYGVDLVSAMIKLTLGGRPNKSDLVSKHKRYLGVRYFFPPIGRIKRIVGMSKVKRLPYLRMLKIYRRKGDYQERITDHTKRGGTIICEGPSYAAAKRRVEDALGGISFLV